MWNTLNKSQKNDIKSIQNLRVNISRVVSEQQKYD